MENKAIIIFKIQNTGEEFDLEIPLDITANDLLNALNVAFDLGIDTFDSKNCYLKADNPIALLRGNRKLSDYRLHNGSIINFTE